jgi:hypothetical protein
MADLTAKVTPRADLTTIHLGLSVQAGSIAARALVTFSETLDADEKADEIAIAEKMIAEIHSQTPKKADKA